MGLLRLYLALCVVVYHGIALGFYNLLLFDGRQAVQLFYVLSGFYITMVIREKYSVKGGTRVFYLKRILRILPLFFTVFVLSLMAIFTQDHVVTTWTNTPAMEFVAKANASVWSALLVWGSNALIVGSDVLWLVGIGPEGLFYAPFKLNSAHNGANFAINGPAFTLAIELYFYLLAPFVVRNVRRAWVFFILGVLYHLVLRYTGNWNLITSYHLFPGSFVYFGMGALVYYFSKGEFSARHFRGTAGVVALLMVALWRPSDSSWDDANALQMWFLVALSYLWVPFLFRRTRHSKIDAFLGDMSYVVYVLHYPFYMYGYYTPIRPFMGLWLLEVAALVTLYVERPLERWRAKLR